MRAFVAFMDKDIEDNEGSPFYPDAFKVDKDSGELRERNITEYDFVGGWAAMRNYTLLTRHTLKPSKRRAVEFQIKHDALTREEALSAPMRPSSVWCSDEGFHTKIEQDVKPFRSDETPSKYAWTVELGGQKGYELFLDEAWLTSTDQLEKLFPNWTELPISTPVAVSARNFRYMLRGVKLRFHGAKVDATIEVRYNSHEDALDPTMLPAKVEFSYKLRIDEPDTWTTAVKEVASEFALFVNSSIYASPRPMANAPVTYASPTTEPTLLSPISTGLRLVPSTDEEGEEGLSNGVLIGVVAAALVLLFVFAFLGYHSGSVY